MYWIGVDLGSTNTKAALYDANMQCVRMESVPVVYARENGHVEFDGDALITNIVELLRTLSAGHAADIGAITLTGQAESLVVLDENRSPLLPVISWMDERSGSECAEMERRFPGEECYAHTGQPAALPTWPATKILWLQRHMPEVFAKAVFYMLLKDYVVYRLTGVFAADCSIATFSFYFDIYQKQYWQEMLDFIGVSQENLPPLVEPCTEAGTLMRSIAREIGLVGDVPVNIGTLDHFAGMVGTGNTACGGMSLSIGTVMGLSLLAAAPVRRDTGIPMHYGFIPDTYVMLPVSESGGVCLDWFKRTCMPEVSYAALNVVLSARPVSEIVFLPYIVGTNAPQFDRDACGMFFGLRSRHDAFDMARAVMEGVGHLLKQNCDAIQDSGTPVTRIIATGGGAKSDVWCQILSDITGIPVEIPMQPEAACLGAAIIGAVAASAFSSYAAAAADAVRIRKRFSPAPSPDYARKHAQFLQLYDVMLSARRMLPGSQDGGA